MPRTEWPARQGIKQNSYNPRLTPKHPEQSKIIMLSIVVKKRRAVPPHVCLSLSRDPRAQHGKQEQLWRLDRSSPRLTLYSIRIYSR